MTRFAIDFAAIFCAIASAYYFTGNAIVGVVAGAITGLYGFWCFADGVTSINRKATNDRS